MEGFPPSSAKNSNHNLIRPARLPEDLPEMQNLTPAIVPTNKQQSC